MRTSSRSTTILSNTISTKAWKKTKKLAESRGSGNTFTETTSIVAVVIDRNTARLEADRIKGEGHHARYRHLVAEAGSIVGKKDGEDSEDGDEEGETAAAKETENIFRKDAAIRRLIEERRSTPKRGKTTIERSEQMHQKMYERKEKSEKTTSKSKEFLKTSKVSATSQESNLQRRQWSLQRLRMNEEKSLHHLKGLPMSLVNSTKKLYDDNEQDEYGNESNTDVHNNDTEK